MNKTFNDRMNQSLDNSNYEKVMKQNQSVNLDNVATMENKVTVKYNDGIISYIPADVAAVGQKYADELVTDPRTSWLQPFLSKKIIWTLSPICKTAFTDGIRVAFNPTFAKMLFSEGSADLLKYKQDNHIIEMDSDDANEIRSLKFKYVLVHECYHQLYQHIRRSILKNGLKNDKKISTIENYAMDMEINRDIESFLDQFAGCTKAVKGVWFEDSEWINQETGKPFSHEAWDEIFDYLIDHQSQFASWMKDMEDAKTDGNVTNTGRSDANKQGWQDAVNNILNKNIDPFKI